MASASDVTKLRSIKNTINFPISNCGDYTTYLKTYTVLKNCGLENTCNITSPVIPNCNCGTSLVCGYNDIIGNKPINYFGLNIKDDLANCKTHNFNNILINNDTMNTTILRNNLPPMFNPPLKSVQPAMKMKNTSVFCCPDKNLKNPRIKKNIKYYITTPIYPVSLLDVPSV